jgi:DNA-entry nuclease
LGLKGELKIKLRPSGRGFFWYNKGMKKLKLLITATLLLAVLTGCTDAANEALDKTLDSAAKTVKEASPESSLPETSTPDSEAAPTEPAPAPAVDENGFTAYPQQPLAYNAAKQLVLQPLDGLRRAVDAHIQLSDGDEPASGTRTGSFHIDPVGWHNYKLKTSTGKTAWLFDRGHLVGWQFSGLMDEARNLVPETKYFNEGGETGMNGSNVDAMLFYENHLDNWLALHPNYKLDYQVTPMYQGSELLPRKVRLAYVGYDENGQTLEIKLGGGHEQAGAGGATVVYLDNVSPAANIDYATGMATQGSGEAAPEATPAQSDNAAQSQSAAANPTTETGPSGWAIAQEGYVYVSKSGIMYHRVTNPGNYQYMTEDAARAAGNRQPIRGNSNAQW